MGFLDRAKKLAEQAKTVAEQAKEMAEGALSEARARTGTSTSADDDGGGQGADPRMGTAYRPGMLGRPGWREQGLADPAAVLPIADRDGAGIPHSTKSEIVEEPYGMGRRWTAAGRSVGLFYQLYPEHQEWEPPGGRAALTGLAGPASQATLSGGRALVFLGHGERSVVLETDGLDDPARTELVRAVVTQLRG